MSTGVRALFVWGGILLALGGCASMQPLSNYARTGDTVMISLGGTRSHALVPILDKDAITITVTDSAGVSYPVKLRNLFRLYSDPTSAYNFRAPASFFTWDQYVGPHQGAWMAVIDLVDPATDTPPPLAVGPATLSVSSPELTPTNPGTLYNDGDLSAIPIDILAGAGAPSPMNQAWLGAPAPLDSLEPEPQVEVTTSGTPSTLVGGASFTFSYVTASFTTDPGNGKAPRVVTTSPDPNLQLASTHIDQGDGTTLLKVLITNPNGFNVDNSRAGLTDGRSLFDSLRFSVVWDKTNTATPITDANWQNALQFVSGEYYDLDGNPMPELAAAVVAKVK